MGGGGEWLDAECFMFKEAKRSPDQNRVSATSDVLFNFLQLWMNGEDGRRTLGVRVH